MCFYTLTLIKHQSSATWIDVRDEANVWGQGALLWKVCQEGDTPYFGLSDDKANSKMLGGEEFKRFPPIFQLLQDSALYSLMTLCWQLNNRSSLDPLLTVLKLQESHSEDLQMYLDAVRMTLPVPRKGVSEARISKGEKETASEGKLRYKTISEFIPSIWNCKAKPKKSALHTPGKKKVVRRNVNFKQENYQYIYKYPRERCEIEDEEERGVLQQRQWHTWRHVSYSKQYTWQSQRHTLQSQQHIQQSQQRTWPSPPILQNLTYSGWKYGEGQVEEAESDSDDYTSPQQLVKSDDEFQGLENFNFETITQMNLDDRDLISNSSTQPLHTIESTQFFSGITIVDGFLVELKPCIENAEEAVISVPDQLILDGMVTENLQDEVKLEEPSDERENPKALDLFIEPLLKTPLKAQFSPKLGELRHSRKRLKIDQWRGGA